MTSCSTAMPKYWADVLRPTLVALLFACPLALQPHSARAETRITGGPETVRVEAREASLDEVLAALAAKFQIHYRANVALDRMVSGTFSGSLSRVVARLLDGYDRVVKKGPDGLDVVILSISSKSSSPGSSAVATKPAENRRVVMVTPSAKAETPRSGAANEGSVQKALTAMALTQTPGAVPPASNNTPAGYPTRADIAGLTRSAGALLENLRSSLGRLPR